MSPWVELPSRRSLITAVCTEVTRRAGSGQNRQRLWTLSAWYARRQVELTGVGTVGTPIARPVFAFDLRLQKEGHQFSVDEQGAVVADQAHPSEPIHKETHSRTGRADHLRKSLLAYLEDSGP